MPIRFKCPNPKCQKVLNVKDHLAGKRAPCPACKQVLTIPYPTAAPSRTRPAPAASDSPPTTAETSTATTTNPADAEDLAHSLLADEPKPIVPTEPAKTITITCDYCAEEVEFDAALAGKQAPCPNPECRRIIKVPLPKKPDKVDWRNTNPGLPSAARRPTEPVPEGAWGSTTKTVASREALEEADALPSQRRDPLTKSQWAVRILLGSAVVGVVLVGVMIVLNLIGGKKQQKLFAKAMDSVSTDGNVKGESAAVIHYSAALYHLNRNEKDSVKADKEAGSWNQFGAARSRLLPTVKTNVECDAMLIELALAQIDLAGNSDQVSDRKRLSWTDTRNEVRSSLASINNPEAKREGLRRVVRKLIEKNQAGIAEELADQLNDGPGPLAVVGLEFRRAKEDERVQKILKQILGQIAASKPKPGQRPLTAPVAMTPEVVTFLLLYGHKAEIPAAKKDEEKDILQVGEAVLPAWQERPDDARALALKLKSPLLKFEALAAIADAAIDEAAVRMTVESAIGVADGFGNKPVPAWTVLRLINIGQRASVEESHLLALAAKVSEKGLRGWAQLPVARARLTRESGKAEDSLLDQVESGSLANRLLRVELARHNTRKDSGMEKVVDGWDESVRPFGYMGVALGMQGSD